jgi:predicted acyl esterase
MAAVVTDFPHTLRVVEHIWIPMSDGCRLAAKLWIPEGAQEQPVPAVLEVTATMTATSDAYHVTNVLEGFEGTARVFAKTWHWSLPRDYT